MTTNNNKSYLNIQASLLTVQNCNNEISHMGIFPNEVPNEKHYCSSTANVKALSTSSVTHHWRVFCSTYFCWLMFECERVQYNKICFLVQHFNKKMFFNYSSPHMGAKPNPAAGVVCFCFDSTLRGI